MEIGNYRFQFMATTRAKVFYVVYVVVGIASLIYLAGNILSGIYSFNIAAILIMLLLLSFIAFGCYMLYSITAPIIFDKYIKYFWKGRGTPDETGDMEKLKAFAHLEDIHALQLLSKYNTPAGSRSYYSYELNLVLQNGDRINVVCHGDKEALRKDTQVLSKFLGKPVWDAIGNRE